MAKLLDQAEAFEVPLADFPPCFSFEDAIELPIIE